MRRELSDPSGGYYSSLDADSEGEEGKYYVWTPEELKEAIQDQAAFELYQAAYGVTENGNFEGKNILQRALTDQELAERFNLPANEVPSRPRATPYACLEDQAEACASGDRR